jgi:hypothetical protein
MRNALQHRVKFLLTLLVFSSLAWAADVPWKGKPYDQWTTQDVERVFTDSPWARTATVTRTWRLLTQQELPDAMISGAARGMPTTQGPSNDNAGNESTFDVYWASSRVVRAASARKAVLRGSQKNLDVEKYANQPQEEYQILVQSLQSNDMVPFVRHEEKFFEANAFLELRKSKQKLPPSHVRFERDEKGQLVTSAIFFFPKKTPSGDPTIGRDEKGVEFTCKIEGSTLRVNFEPQKMADNNGPAL